jgi:hypothetical protein
MAELSRDELLDILEASAAGQLKALRALRPPTRRRSRSPTAKGKSNIAIVEDLLQWAGRPLHIHDIIAQARARFGRTLSRESLVSALTKKVLDHHTFCRVGPNTFDLLHRQAKP